MRMWMIDPAVLCRKHLLGEHVELHKHLPSLKKGHKIDGRFDPVIQIQLNAIEDRHNDLAIEMKRRGYKHESPLLDVPDFSLIYPKFYDMEVDISISFKDLIERCEKCKERIFHMYPTITKYAKI